MVKQHLNRAALQRSAREHIQLTADFVRRFAQLGELMRIYTEASSFEHALTAATGQLG
jgi:hypothetical protein